MRDLKKLALDIGYTKEEAWKHAVLIHGMNSAIFGSKLTETGLYPPLYLTSQSVGRYAAKKYIRDFKIPDDIGGIPYFVKINSTLFMNPSEYRKPCSWKTFACPYATYVSKAGSYLVCELCRGYTVGWVNCFKKGAVERTKYVLAGDDLCEYSLELDKEQKSADYTITETVPYEQVVQILTSKCMGLLNEYIPEVAGWLKDAESLEGENKIQFFVDYALKTVNEVLGTLTNNLFVNSSFIIEKLFLDLPELRTKEMIKRYCRETGMESMDIVLNGMPPLYYGWKDKYKSFEELLAVYVTTLDLNTSFGDDILVVGGCKWFDILKEMVDKNEYLMYVRHEDLEENFKNSSCEVCKNQIERLALGAGYHIEKVSQDNGKCKFEFKKLF